MRSLTKDQAKRWEVLSNAVEEKNTKVCEANAEYNAALQELAAFRDELVADMEAYRDERSDKWHESDAASNYEDWIQEYENIELDGVEDPDLPDTNPSIEVSG